MHSNVPVRLTTRRALAAYRLGLGSLRPGANVFWVLVKARIVIFPDATRA